MLKTNGTELIDESADVCLHFSGHVTSPAFGRVLSFCWNFALRILPLVHLLWKPWPAGPLWPLLRRFSNLTGLPH